MPARESQFASSVRQLPLTVARRLAVSAQRLAGSRPRPDANGILDVVRSIRCVQIDPMSIVAPSHLLVIWSRLGKYDARLLDRLLWDDRALFEDWAHATSIVLTEDYPLFSAFKRGFATGNSKGSRKVREWMNANRSFRSYILREIRRRGPLLSRDLDDRAKRGWASSGWTSGRNVDMMLVFLAAKGILIVARRKGGEKMYDLADRFLPSWTPRQRLTMKGAVYQSSQKALRALGVATQKHIEEYFMRGCYPGLSSTLTRLEAEHNIERVEVINDSKHRMSREPWYVHADNLPLLDRLAAGDWEPSTTLLSPFDNLIYDRRKTEQLFNFKFSLEVYLPKPKRKYGYYVMPILQGDRLIGRADPLMDRKTSVLTINAIHAEPDAPMTTEAAKSVANAFEELGSFLGAREIVYEKRIPEGWKNTLH